jgi:5-methylcytosine-specific restriction endonuclease McrA
MKTPSRIDGKQNPEYFKAYYEKNRARIRAAQKARYDAVGTNWRLSNQNYKRMAISLLLERDGDCCWLCGDPMRPEEISIDHILQRAAGGTDDAVNLALAHRACNMARPKPRRDFSGTPKKKVRAKKKVYGQKAQW